MRYRRAGWVARGDGTKILRGCGGGGVGAVEGRRLGWSVPLLRWLLVVLWSVLLLLLLLLRLLRLILLG